MIDPQQSGRRARRIRNERLYELQKNDFKFDGADELAVDVYSICRI